MEQTGGCLCGYLRYRLSAEPIDAGFCHCRACQKSAGAPVLAWLTLPRQAFAYTAGEAAVYASSPHGQRAFCPRCGSQLLFQSDHLPDTLDVTLASLDHPEAILPQYHIWTASQIAWLHLADTLPRYADAGPDEHL